MKQAIKTRISKALNLIKKFLHEGLDPKKLALAIILGSSFGMLPFLGTNTILLIGVALIFRLNQAITQVFNYAVYPIQIICYIPFLKIGGWISGNPHLSLTFQQIRAAYRESWWQAVVNMWYIHLWGVLVWIVLITPIAVFFYFVLVKMFTDYRNGKKNYLIRKISSFNQRISIGKIPPSHKADQIV